MRAGKVRVGITGSRRDVCSFLRFGWNEERSLAGASRKQFDVFITVDRNLSYQQPLSKFSIAIIVLRAHTNRLKDLLPLAQKTLQMISEIQAGNVAVIE